jgi:hypothetical protein
MFEHIEELIRQHASGGVLVDTNLLILLLIGQTRPDLIGQYPHTKEYSLEDFRILSRLLERFRFVRTTPHILTEVSNLSGKLHGEVLKAFRLHFSVSVTKFEERTCSIQRSVGNAYFTRLGFTDASICEIAGDDNLVLTADLPLANVLEHLGGHVINFNHIRVLGW